LDSTFHVLKGKKKDVFQSWVGSKTSGDRGRGGKKRFRVGLQGGGEKVLRLIQSKKKEGGSHSVIFEWGRERTKEELRFYFLV